jgi:hypothetical protein
MSNGFDHGSLVFANHVIAREDVEFLSLSSQGHSEGGAQQQRGLSVARLRCKVLAIECSKSL